MSGPHDHFVRFTFGHPERAAAELRAVLPAHVVSEVDWATLRQEPGSVVDPGLRKTESDLLFSARLYTGHPLLRYVLLEHQSSVDRWMALRMLRYVVRLVDLWRQEHPESTRLPVIIPLVMYHGAGETWTAPRRVEELFDLPEAGGSVEGTSWPAPRPAGVAGPALRAHRGIVRTATRVDGALRAGAGRPRRHREPPDGHPLPALYRGQHSPRSGGAGAIFGDGCATRGGGDAGLGRGAHRAGDAEGNAEGVGTGACGRTCRGCTADSRRTRGARS